MIVTSLFYQSNHTLFAFFFVDIFTLLSQWQSETLQGDGKIKGKSLRSTEEPPQTKDLDKLDEPPRRRLRVKPPTSTVNGKRRWNNTSGKLPAADRQSVFHTGCSIFYLCIRFSLSSRPARAKILSLSLANFVRESTLNLFALCRTTHLTLLM